MELPVVTETAGLGTAYLAGLGVGFWESKDELGKHWKAQRVFEPHMGEDEREAMYAGWKKAVERSFHWAQKINGAEIKDKATPHGVALS